MATERDLLPAARALRDAANELAWLLGNGNLDAPPGELVEALAALGKLTGQVRELSRDLARHRVGKIESPHQGRINRRPT
jgi:hypothetical protein